VVVVVLLMGFGAVELGGFMDLAWEAQVEKALLELQARQLWVDVSHCIMDQYIRTKSSLANVRLSIRPKDHARRQRFRGVCRPSGGGMAVGLGFLVFLGHDMVWLLCITAAKQFRDGVSWQSCAEVCNTLLVSVVLDLSASRKRRSGKRIASFDTRNSNHATTAAGQKLN
jgi:hypothetical protein